VVTPVLRTRLVFVLMMVLVCQGMLFALSVITLRLRDWGTDWRASMSPAATKKVAEWRQMIGKLYIGFASHRARALWIPI